ncbi:MAG TPA: hypothetical protein VFX61_07290 [Micromonosporaceae bacterium]|nr:hypothetical protein [Micromonosporaceae bacterium]
MRHIWSLLAGVVTAPLAWILISAGQSGSDRTISSWVKTDSFSWGNLIGPAVYLAVAGLLLGLIGTLRFSPAGPLAAGLLLVTPYAALFAKPFVVRDAIPTGWQLSGEELPLHLPLDNGTLLLIGALLLMATFSIQRWRRWPAPETTTPVDAKSDAEERTLTDWPPSEPKKEPEPELAAPTLSFAEPASSSIPLPRRDRTSSSPWAAPPRSGVSQE